MNKTFFGYMSTQSDLSKITKNVPGILIAASFTLIYVYNFKAHSALVRSMRDSYQ